MQQMVYHNSMQLATTYKNRGQFIPRDTLDMMREVGKSSVRAARNVATKYDSPGPVGLRKLGYPFAANNSGSGTLSPKTFLRSAGRTKRQRAALVSRVKRSMKPYPDRFLGYGYGKDGRRFADQFWSSSKMIRGRREVRTILANRKRASDGAPLIKYFMYGTRKMVPRPIHIEVLRRLRQNGALNRIQNKWARKNIGRNKIGATQVRLRT